MTDIFSNTNPFPSADPSCEIVSPLTSVDFTYGIDCPPSGCASSGILDDLPYKFLNCYISSFSGKLGLGGEESSITIELIDTSSKDCEAYPPSGCLTEGAEETYNGTIGSVYSFQIGGFSFRGILTNHDYKEGSDGFKYSVTLSDGKQVLSNVSVIVNGLYSNNTNLGPNLINAVAIKNNSVSKNVDCYLNNGTLDGSLCDDFGKAGVNNKGMYVHEAISAMNGQKCKIPVSGLCLTLDLDLLLGYIDGQPLLTQEARLTSDVMSALEIIEYACNESGYVFFTQIIDDRIVVVPISQKEDDKNPADDTPLFTFMNSLQASNIVIDRDYGQEMTYNKSQKLIFGDKWRYMLIVDYTEFACGDGDQTNEEPAGTQTCDLFPPAAHEYRRIEHNYFSGGGTIVGDNNDTCVPEDE